MAILLRTPSTATMKVLEVMAVMTWSGGWRELILVSVVVPWHYAVRTREHRTMLCREYFRGQNMGCPDSLRSATLESSQQPQTYFHALTRYACLKPQGFRFLRH